MLSLIPLDLHNPENVQTAVILTKKRLFEITQRERKKQDYGKAGVFVAQRQSLPLITHFLFSSSFPVSLLTP